MSLWAVRHKVTNEYVATFYGERAEEVLAQAAREACLKWSKGPYAPHHFIAIDMECDTRTERDYPATMVRAMVDLILSERSAR